MVEFALVGIPIIFVLISIFEMARGMWLYHTVAYAVREGTRFAIVHGTNCNASDSPSKCPTYVSDVAGVILSSGIGLMPDDLVVTMRSVAGSSVLWTSGEKTLSQHLTNTTTLFPPTCDPGVTCSYGAASDVGIEIYIYARYPFRSALVYFWPGASTTMTIPVVNLGASSREKIQF